MLCKFSYNKMANYMKSYSHLRNFSHIVHATNLGTAENWSILYWVSWHTCSCSNIAGGPCGYSDMPNDVLVIFPPGWHLWQAIPLVRYCLSLFGGYFLKLIKWMLFL